MEEILSQAFSTGDIKIVIVAVILYFVIAIQRGNTKKDRDSTAAAKYGSYAKYVATGTTGTWTATGYAP